MSYGKLFKVTAGLIMIACASWFVPAWASSRPEKMDLKHKVSLPSIPPEVMNNPNCTAEAAAYAAALVDLENAETAANEALNAWYECEFGYSSNAPEAKKHLAEAGESVLTR